MKIVIIGWYGTETIGDRAILAGLYNVFSGSYGDFDIRLGCLNTVLSERTIKEDYDFWIECTQGKLKSISLFDSRKRNDLDEAISWGDIVAIGGGPLMELDAMYMLLYAFKRAKYKKKICMVAGCGMGPFKTQKLKDIATKIVDIADVVVFRDDKSQEIYLRNTKIKKKTISIIDPAAIAAYCFLEKKQSNIEKNYAAVNFREPPSFEYDGLDNLNETYFVELLATMFSHFEGFLRFVPMHTFEIGGDDRFFLNKIARLLKKDDTIVDNKPLSLKETMCVYSEASCCVGMRFHSILLQTILNGKNIILDYTDPKAGKIINLLNQLSLKECYADRYVSLVTKQEHLRVNVNDIEKVVVHQSILRDFREKYIILFNSLVNNEGFAYYDY